MNFIYNLAVVTPDDFRKPVNRKVPGVAPPQNMPTC